MRGDTDFIENILIGSGFTTRVVTKRGWGEVVRFQHDGQELFAADADHNRKTLHVYTWPTNEDQYCCSAYEEDHALTEGWQIETQLPF